MTGSGQRASARNAARPGSRDRGSASVWVLAVGLAVVSVGLMGVSVGAAVVARHQAQAAADLGALAAALHAVEGREVACRHAAAIVTANSARLISCRIDGLDAVVTAQVEPAGLPAVIRPAEASARAGPAMPP